MATLSLDAISTEILLDTFRRSLNDNGFVDALSYRAEHEDWIEKLNELEQRQFLKRDGNSYRVTFVVLTLIDDEQVAVERSRCKHLFAILRDHYKNSTTRNQEKRLKVLSDELELSYEQTSLTVRYFMDVSPLWHAGRGGSANPDIELSEISASMGDGNRLPRSRSNEKTPP